MSLKYSPKKNLQLTFINLVYEFELIITCPRGPVTFRAHVCSGWYAPIAISVSLVPSKDLWLMFADPTIKYSSSTIIPFECT